MINLSAISKNDKMLLLAYDQGMEHGPTDFNDESIDPYYILEIGIRGGFTGIIFQKGVAEKYYDQKYQQALPLIVKLNGKTNLVKTEEPYSPLLCTVDEAKKLGAKAVGYTVYIGSEHEETMLEELGKIVYEAHNNNLPVIGWMYPRGKNVKNPHDPKIIAYSARIGLEIGVDLVKVFYPGNVQKVREVVKASGKTGVVISGGKLANEEEFLTMAKNAILGGARGLAVGRNVWQRPDPLIIAEKLKKIVWGDL